ncbi:hypothetical protein [Wenxinia saemankumensis]|uniref:Uncharacterized protein n=1 Tax=Wenxinia saemankumensis TaxID=1447782 RepID=A0A1M6FRA1_9RHOB|nr:hypothetical protein [Wenxinia saemankumensis]SHJ00237.1 hypothetical protein SAMN05444417_2459 [Wenxinia saemankumensis]
MRLALLFALAPFPALAQTFPLPAACEGIVTVQQADCTVTSYFDCAGENPEHLRFVSHGATGLIAAGVLTRAWQWLEQDWPTGRETLVPGAADPIDQVAVLANGEDTFDFEMDSAEFGRTRYRGHDRLTGASVKVGGVEMLEATFGIEASQNDTVTMSAEGTEYYIPAFGILASGTARFDYPDQGSFETDATPRAFAAPGEDGHMSIIPQFGCGG